MKAVEIGLICFVGVLAGCTMTGNLGDHPDARATDSELASDRMSADSDAASSDGTLEASAESGASDVLSDALDAVRSTPDANSVDAPAEGAPDVGPRLNCVPNAKRVFLTSATYTGNLMAAGAGAS